MKNRVRRLVQYYTKICSTNDPFEIASFLGIHVGLYPLGNIAGTYKYLEHSRWVFINSDMEASYRTIIMAHELGHAVLHQKENCCFMAHHTLMLTSKIERQANMFTAYLLITEELLEDYAGCTREQFCDCTGYPQELLELRLKFF